ncbi:hypothetical protein [Streptomyces sp. NPDC054783]
MVADHPEAADDAVVTECAIAVETEFAAVVMGHHAEGLAAGSHDGDRRATVAVEAPEDLDGPPAFVEDIEAVRARSAGRGDAPLNEGGVRTFVDEDPSGSPVAVTASTAAVTSTAVAAPVSASAPVLRLSGVVGRLGGVVGRLGGVVGRLGRVVEWLGGVVGWLGCPVDRRGSRGGFDGRGIGYAGGCKDGRAYSGADHSESTRGHGHFSLSYVRRPDDRPATNVPMAHITGIPCISKV